MVMKVFPLDLDEDLHRRLKHAAIDSGISLHEYIIQSLKERVDNDKPPLGKKRKRYAQPATRNR